MYSGHSRSRSVVLNHCLKRSKYCLCSFSSSSYCCYSSCGYGGGRRGRGRRHHCSILSTEFNHLSHYGGILGSCASLARNGPAGTICTMVLFSALAGNAEDLLRALYFHYQCFGIRDWTWEGDLRSSWDVKVPWRSIFFLLFPKPMHMFCEGSLEIA